MPLFAIIRRLAVSAIEIFDILLFARAILSWLPQVKLYNLREFLFYTTEPLLSPIRNFLYRFDWARRLPIDLSWIVLYIILGMLSYAIMY